MSLEEQEHFKKNAILKFEAGEAITLLQENLMRIQKILHLPGLNDLAKRYIQLGVLRRYITLEKDWRWIVLNLPIDRKIGLSTIDTQEAALHLNSLYLHILGILDNFAWAFLYQIAPEKANAIPRKEVGLFSRKVQEFLPDGIEKENIKSYLEWYKNVSEKRHPVAHRLPLYVPPQILLSAEDNKQKQELDFQYDNNIKEFIQQYSQIARQDNSNLPIQAMTDQIQKMNQLEKEHEEKQQAINLKISELGSFVPGFMYPEEDILYPIYPEVTHDVKKLACLTNDCLSIMQGICKI